MIKVLLYEITQLKLHVWERLTKTCPCWLPWRLSTSLAVSLHLSPHASLQEWVGAPWQESRHQEVPCWAQEHIWVRARKVFSAEAGEKGMMLFIHACFMSAVAVHAVWCCKSRFLPVSLKRTQHTHSLVVLSDLGRWLVLVMLWYTVLCIAYMTWSYRVFIQ